MKANINILTIHKIQNVVCNSFHIISRCMLKFKVNSVHTSSHFRSLWYTNLLQERRGYHLFNQQPYQPPMTNVSDDDAVAGIIIQGRNAPSTSRSALMRETSSPPILRTNSIWAFFYFILQHVLIFYDCVIMTYFLDLKWKMYDFLKSIIRILFSRNTSLQVNFRSG